MGPRGRFGWWGSVRGSVRRAALPGLEETVLVARARGAGARGDPAVNSGKPRRRRSGSGLRLGFPLGSAPGERGWLCGQGQAGLPVSAGLLVGLRPPLPPGLPALPCTPNPLGGGLWASPGEAEGCGDGLSPQGSSHRGGHGSLAVPLTVMLQPPQCPPKAAQGPR